MEPVDLAEVKDADYMIDLLDQRIYEQGMYVKPTSRKNSIHIIGEVAKKIEDIDEEGENFWIYANETDLFLESGSDFWHAAIKNDEVSDLEEMPEGYVKSITPTDRKWKKQMPCKRSAGRLCQDLRRWNSHGLHGSEFRWRI